MLLDGLHANSASGVCLVTRGLLGDNCSGQYLKAATTCMAPPKTKKRGVNKPPEHTCRLGWIATQSGSAACDACMRLANA